MRSLMYLSTAARPMIEGDLISLLEQSRAKNSRLGITGLLLFKSHHFMQLIEGDDESIFALYSEIEADSRHRNVRLLLSAPIATREFPSWSMGFEAVSEESTRETPGYDDFLELSRTGGVAWEDPTRTAWLLNWFRSRNFRVTNASG